MKYQDELEQACRGYAKATDRLHRYVIVGIAALFLFGLFMLPGCTVSHDTAPMPDYAENPCDQPLSDADRELLEAQKRGEVQVRSLCQSPGEKAMSKRFKAVLEKPVQ